MFLIPAPQRHGISGAKEYTADGQNLFHFGYGITSTRALRNRKYCTRILRARIVKRLSFDSKIMETLLDSGTLCWHLFALLAINPDYAQNPACWAKKRRKRLMSEINRAVQFALCISSS
jgi:hypothetical protein